jgi:hypothetical protein
MAEESTCLAECFRESPRIIRVGEIAASSAGEQQLVSGGRIGLDHQRGQLARCGVDRRHQPRWPSPDNANPDLCIYHLLFSIYDLLLRRLLATAES